MRLVFVIAALVAVALIAGCGGSSDDGASRVQQLSEPFAFLPPNVTFTYEGTASVSEAGATRTVPASSIVSIGRPGFTDPRTNTPVLLYTQTLNVETVENLLYRDFFFSQPGRAFVAHGSEVFGVTTFDFTPTALLPAQLVEGQLFGQSAEPYQTLVVRLRGGAVIRSDRITVAGAVIDAFEVHFEREIPFSRALTRVFDERMWYAPSTAGPVPIKQYIRYLHDGMVVTVNLSITGIPALP